MKRQCRHHDHATVSPLKNEEWRALCLPKAANTLVGKGCVRMSREMKNAGGSNSTQTEDRHQEKRREQRQGKQVELGLRMGTWIALVISSVWLCIP